MAIYTVKKDYDVVVAGGGLAGVCAAIAAARHGARTALVQNRSVLGGPSSSECRVNIGGGSARGTKPNANETGILMELLLENKLRNPHQEFPIWDVLVWEKVRFQENLDLYRNTSVDGAVMEAGRIREVICRQNTSETEYTLTGKIFVDATGHGSLGLLCGAAYAMGSESRDAYQEKDAPEAPNHDTMGNTIMFHAVDRGRPVPFHRPFWAKTYTEHDLRNRKHLDLVMKQGNEGGITAGEGEAGVSKPEFFSVDCGYWWIELGGDWPDLVRQSEEIHDELMAVVFGVWDHLKNGGDHGVANYELDWVGVVAGTRESRRLLGDYVLTENDVLANRIFDDAVAYGGWPMDIHPAAGVSGLELPPSRLINFPGLYTIPYRCYCSRTIPNLMMAGRDISASHLAFSSSRLMGTCAVGGQAVGTAAAMAVRDGCDPRDVGRQSIHALQQALLKDDCYIPGFRNEDPLDLARSASVTASSWQEGGEPEKVVNGVSRSVNGDTNCWISGELAGEEAALLLSLPEPALLREIRLTFDPNLSREMMPSMVKSILARQHPGVSPELARDYDVELLLAGRTVEVREVRGNHQRLNVLTLDRPRRCDAVRIRVKQTWGDPCARIFEVRLYR